MNYRLDWREICIQDKIQGLLQLVQTTAANTQQQNTRNLSKFERWMSDLNHIIVLLNRIQYELGPRLDDVLAMKISDDELLRIALFQPSTKNVFLELEAHFCTGDSDLVESDVFKELAALSEIAKTLALVGDAAISMAIIHHLWSPMALEVGKLTQSRADIVSNENMSRLCDCWDLYGYRIHFEPPSESKSEMEHIKGTLVESIYGIIYMRYGLQKLRETVHHLIDV